MPESFFHNESRVDKFDKRRKNTKLINFLIGLGAFFAIFLILLIVFGDDDEKETVQDENNVEDINESQQEPDVEEENDSIAAPNDEESNTITDEETEENTDPNDTASNEEIENIEPTEETVLESDDPNVLKTIVKNWQPIGTEQEEPHVATYDQSSQDWQEMWAAARYATGLSEDDEIQWWATNGGSEHKAILTISNKAQTETYRVYIEWVANQGWKPTMVDVLKENDIKEKYFSDTSESEDEADNESEE